MTTFDSVVVLNSRTVTGRKLLISFEPEFVGSPLGLDPKFLFLKPVLSDLCENLVSVLGSDSIQ